MKYIGWIILLCIAILAVSFAALNARMVLVEYYIGSKEMPLSLLMLLIFVLGICIGILTLIPTLFRLKFELRRARHLH